MTIRRPIIERTTPFEARSSDDGLNLSGHALVFGQWTHIRSWEGEFEESVRRGATKKTFEERTPVIQFEHGRHPLIGSIPIASFNDSSPSEDDKGVDVQARMVDNWLMLPVRDAIANGTVNGMSFRFEVIRDRWTDRTGKELSPVEVDKLLWQPGNRGPLRRELIEIKIPELGPVVFAAYQGTDVSVRARQTAEQVRSDPDLTMVLRRSLAVGGSPEGDPYEGADLRQLAVALLFDHSERTSEPIVDHPDDEPPADPAPIVDHPESRGEKPAPTDTGHPENRKHKVLRLMREQYLVQHGIHSSGDEE